MWPVPIVYHLSHIFMVPTLYLPLSSPHPAGKPKKAGALITICLMLGPDFISDTIVVETSDHARLKVAIAMNNVFRVCACFLETPPKNL